MDKWSLYLDSTSDLSQLEVEFIMERNKETTFALGAEKALGTDSFPILLF